MELLEVVEELDAQGEEPVGGQEMLPAQPAGRARVDLEENGDGVQDVQGAPFEPQAVGIDPVHEPVDGYDDGGDESRSFALRQGLAQVDAGPLLGEDDPAPGIVLPIGAEPFRDGGDKAVLRGNESDVHSTASKRASSM